MEQQIIESSYPLSFREEDAKELGRHLKARHSVVLIGMKRVGISNFLRFFLHHKNIATTYIGEEKHLFIQVDLIDLVEREIFPFWTLTLKRIEDSVMASDLPDQVKKDIEILFLDSIQSQDLFLTIDSVRKAIIKLVENGVLPTIFFIRFDRMKDAVTPAVFDNLQGLRDATHEKLSFVFTSFRGLGSLSPAVFTKASLSVFSHDMYVKPARHEDTKVVYETYKNKYKLSLTSEAEQSLFDSVDGYVQYLQYAQISLHEAKEVPTSKDGVFDRLVKDERISLQSEELWESLEKDEQTVLLKVSKGEEVSGQEKEKAAYIFDTGMVTSQNSIFSPLFSYFLKQHEAHMTTSTTPSEFTKKENALFNLLKENMNEICEREKIIEKVWPEAQAFGVTDWAIDRLVARVRSKLKQQQSKFEIQTIKTRGYKLIEG